MEEALKFTDSGVPQGGQSQTQNQVADNQITQEDADDSVDEFDYLAYSQDRAFFFWADILSLGLIREDELPPEMVEHAKKRMIEY